MSRVTIALTGNPNSGKSTIFNALTGQRQHVGNYPGVTVERKEGLCRLGDLEMNVVDLPGTYSLTARSAEEVVARNFLIEQDPQVVVDIIDTANLERNLYLATQLIELEAPLVLAFNMSDLAEAGGYRIDASRLSALLGVPIVQTVGHKGRNLDRLLEAVADVSRDPAAAAAAHRQVDYGPEIEPHVRQMTQAVRDRTGMQRRGRWFAIKLLENDEETHRRVRRLHPGQADGLIAEAAGIRRHIEGICGDSAEIVFADRRYGFISGACGEAVRQTVEARHQRSDRIDAVLTNPYVGLPIFILLMYLVFQLTFSLGNPAADFLAGAIGRLGAWVAGLWPGRGLVESLIVDGVIGGVGAVVAFLPLIVLLFLAIAFLEDSGYMARGAFLVDGLMHRIGLHGKSFIPMLIGFGCTVPAILATRTLESRRDRLTTILVLPLMSCGARLPTYVLILGAMFPPRPLVRGLGVTNQALLLWSMYLIGIVLALAAAKVLRATILRGEVTPFVMELPPYRMPALKGLAVHAGERAWMYLRKAGTVILAIVVVLWAMSVWPRLPRDRTARFEAEAAGARARTDLDAPGRENLLGRIEADRRRAELETSAIGRIGRFIAPAMAPCGFDWKISTALLGSMAAKEVFVGQMGVIYSVGEASEDSATLRRRLAADYTPLQGLCVMLFILIASPCAATVAAATQEAGSWKWAAFLWGYLTALAWVVTAAVYQVGRLIVGG